MSVLEAPDQVAGSSTAAGSFLPSHPAILRTNPPSFPPLGHQFLANIRGGDIAGECRGRWRHLSAGEARLGTQEWPNQRATGGWRPFRDSERVPTSPPRIAANFGRRWAPGGTARDLEGPRRRVVSFGSRRAAKSLVGHRAEIAQLVEHATENRGVASSILALGTTISVVANIERKWLSW